MDVLLDFEPMCPGFESRELHDFFFDFYLFIYLFFLLLLLQCNFANLTLLSLLSFSYFITPYDAQASSAFSALIKWRWGNPKDLEMFQHIVPIKPLYLLYEDLSLFIFCFP